MYTKQICNREVERTQREMSESVSHQGSGYPKFLFTAKDDLPRSQRNSRVSKTLKSSHETFPSFWLSATLKTTITSGIVVLKCEQQLTVYLRIKGVEACKLTDSVGVSLDFGKVIRRCDSIDERFRAQVSGGIQQYGRQSIVVVIYIMIILIGIGVMSTSTPRTPRGKPRSFDSPDCLPSCHS